MTTTDPDWQPQPASQLDILINRAERGTLTPAEASLLRNAVATLQHRVSGLDTYLKSTESNNRALRGTTQTLSDQIKAAEDELEWRRTAGLQMIRLATTLRTVLAEFRFKTHPGTPCLQTGHVEVAKVQKWWDVLNVGDVAVPPAATVSGPLNSADTVTATPYDGRRHGVVRVNGTELALAEGHPAYPRIDTIARHGLQVTVIKGIPSAVPLAPKAPEPWTAVARVQVGRFGTPVTQFDITHLKPAAAPVTPAVSAPPTSADTPAKYLVSIDPAVDGGGLFAEVAQRIKAHVDSVAQTLVGTTPVTNEATPPAATVGLDHDFATGMTTITRWVRVCPICHQVDHPGDTCDSAEAAQQRWQASLDNAGKEMDRLLQRVTETPETFTGILGALAAPAGTGAARELPYWGLIRCHCLRCVRYPRPEQPASTPLNSDNGTCGDVCTGQYGTYTCTRRPGHPSPHIEHREGGRAHFQWHDSTPPAADA